MYPTPRPARRINLFFIVLLLFAACRHCHPHCVTQIRASGGISARALCPASPAYTVSWPDGYDRGPTGTVAACGSGRGLRVRPGGGGGRSPGERPEACAQPTLGCCWVMQWIPPP